VLLALSRIGCFLHGCCVGRLGDWPWCLRYPAGSAFFRLETSREWLPEDAPASHAVHPLPVYFALAALLIAAPARRQNGRAWVDGQVPGVATMLFGLSSAILEGWRLELPARLYWGPLPRLTWIGLGLGLAGVVMLVAGYFGSRPAEPHAGRASAARRA